MKKIFNKKTLIYALSFLIPGLLILGYAIYSDVFVKGGTLNTENFLLADMASQYNALFAFMHDVFSNTASIFYSFSKGIGGNMASTVGYYLGSPFNILYCLVGKNDVPTITFIITLIKFGLAGLFMNIYITKTHKLSFSNLIFSLSYALMGFITVYYFNIMWLDVIFMAPLIILGIDRLFEGKKLLYPITLALTIIFNFYISYMLCIFCVIYFVYKLFSTYKIKEFKKYKGIILDFIISSLLAGLISSFILIPAVYNLSHIKRFTVNPELLKVDYTQFWKRFLNEIFSKTYVAAHNDTSILGRNRPVLYVSLFVIVTAFLYFFNRKIKLKERILSLVVIAFFIVSFMLPQLQLFWQAFSFPNGYIDRFAFLYIFFLITLSAKNFYNKDKIRIWYFLILLAGYITISYFVSKIYLVFIDKQDIWLSVIIVSIYSILFFIYTRIKKDKWLIFLLIILVMGELGYNYIKTRITMETLKVVSSYKTFYNESCKNVNNLDDDFYRVDGNYYYSYLDSYVCGYNGFSTALSTNDGDLYGFFYDHGNSITYTTLYYDFNKLPIFDSLLGIKYVTSKEKLEDPNYKMYDKFQITKYNSFKKIYEKKYVYIYKNDDALNLGYTISPDYDKLYKTKKGKNSFENLNNLFSSITGINDKVLKPYPKKEIDKNTFEFDINNEEDFIYLTNKYQISINWEVYESIYINDNYIKTLESDDVGITKVKNDYKNSKINVRLESYEKRKDVDVYYLDKEVYQKGINKLKETQLKDVKINKNKMSASIALKEDSKVMLAIPYEKGWTIKVDGKKVKYEKVAGDFIGLNLSKGKHKIEMSFISPGFIIGLFISIGSVIILIFLNKKAIKK